MNKPVRDKYGRFAKLQNTAKAKSVPDTGTTHYFLVVDRSSSMTSIRHAAINAVNSRLDSLKNESTKYNHKFTVTLITFSDLVDPTIVSQVPLFDFKPFTSEQYKCYGNTALLDAVGKAVELSEDVVLGPKDAFLIETITDGEENCSNIYATHENYNFLTKKNMVSLPKLLKECSDNGRYTIVFQVPRGYKNALHSSYNVPLDNIHEWEATTIGTQEAAHTTQKAFSGYTQNRSTGTLKVDTFYKDVDLSKVKNSDLSKLDNMTGRFKVLRVDKDVPIREFIEEKTKTPYVVGSTYFQLSKEDLVQPNKQIVIMKKGENQLYGGPKARDLLGLGSNANVKLTPFNLSTFNVFIESRSINRRLVRGTQVLVDTHKYTHSQPTWGSLDKINS